MKRTISTFVASLVLLFGNESFSDQKEIVQNRQLQIQQLMINDEQILLNDLQIDQARGLRSQEELFQMEFERRIEELNEICDLTPPQLKKLRVASKGAILKSVEQQEKDKKNEIDNWINNQILVDLTNLQSNREPFSQPIWINTIQKVLNDQQRQLLAQHEKKENAKRRRANVISYLGQLDNLLNFNSEQRSELYSLIDEKFGKHFEAIENETVFRPLNVLVPAQLMQSADVEEKMRQVLSNDQFQIWQAYSKVGGERQLILDMAEVAQFPNRPMLGVRLVDNNDGAAIHSVIPNSPADRAGLRAGDIIRSIDKDEITQLQDVMKIIPTKEANKKIKLTILRNGEKMDVEAHLVLGKELQ